MKARILWQVTPKPGLFGWQLLMDSQFIRGFLTQRGAIQEARRLMKFEWDTACRVSELKIHAKGGEIRDSDTFPRSSDPEGTKG